QVDAQQEVIANQVALKCVFRGNHTRWLAVNADAVRAVVGNDVDITHVVAADHVADSAVNGHAVVSVAQGAESLLARADIVALYAVVLRGVALDEDAAFDVAGDNIGLADVRAAAGAAAR